MFTEPAAENGLAYASLGLLCLRPLQGAQSGLGTPRRGNPAAHRQGTAPPQRLRQPLAGLQHRQGGRPFQLRPLQEGRNLAPDRAHGRSYQPDQLRPASSTTPRNGFGGNFNLYGVMTFVFIRSALQLHANSGVRDRKLPTLRTYAEKYIKMMPDLVRADGLGWAFGRAAGAYGQMHCISLDPSGPARRLDPRRPEAEVLRSAPPPVRVLLSDLSRSGARLPRSPRRRAHRLRAITPRAWRTSTPRATSASGPASPRPCRCRPAPPKLEPAKTTGRFVIFDKSNRKEQGLFLYRDAESGLHLADPADQLRHHARRRLARPSRTAPASSTGPTTCTLPIMLPELTFGDHVTLPAFYGKNCVTGLGLRNSFYFRYEQPESDQHQGRDRQGPRQREGPVEFLRQQDLLRIRLHGETAGHAR
ncbi:MAG: hypothetical protein QM760_17085 [Nibricoccus sp.]